MDCSKALDSNEPIQYTATEINDIASVLLASLTEEGILTMDEGLKIKTVFNSLMDMLVNDHVTCDNILAETREINELSEERIRDAIEEEAWNVVDAANRIRDDVAKGE